LLYKLSFMWWASGESSRSFAAEAMPERMAIRDASIRKIR
jgi:hypothetical protein